MSIGTALLAVIGAAVLAVVFNYVVGFPANVPIALGGAVLLAELIERAVTGGATMRAVIVASFHGLLAGLAGWLGVVAARAMGLFG